MNNLKIKNIDCHAALAMTKNAQSGRSMIEMLGVLAIIGVLSVGGIAGYSKAMMKYRINKTIEQITLIAGNIRAFWGSQKNYVGVYCNCDNGSCIGQSSDDDCPIHKKAKIFPDDMITVTDGKITSITNPFGGGVVLHADDKAQNRDNQAFRIEYDIGDNEEACIELLSQDWKTAGVSFMMLSNPMYVFETIPVSLDNAADVCSKYTPDISMNFYIDADISCYKSGVCDEDFADSTYY